MVRTRFAPSPTGYLHIGGVRTALFNWLFARQHGGQFILRIDDTDQRRNVKEALAPILDGFKWLGLDWDEGPEVDGPHAPYYQSQRSAKYQAAVEKLLNAGAAYRDYAKPEEIQAERQAAEKEKRSFIYSRNWMADTPEKQAAFEAEGRQGVVRLMMPREGKLVLDDLVRGKVEFEWASEQDHVIQRADGSCLYHLATVVDDHDFAITHVIRAEEHLSNTPRQVFILEKLEYERPQYAHVPYVAEPGSKIKMSKRKMAAYVSKNKAFAKLFRHGEEIGNKIGLSTENDTFNPVLVDFYKQVGYLPDAIVNYLLLLGWSLDDKTEFFMRDEMIKLFTLDRVVKSPASFDPDKLAAFEAHYFNGLPLEEKVRRTLPFLADAGIIPSDPPSDVRAKVSAIIAALGDRVKVAGDVVLQSDFFFAPDHELVYSEKDFNKRIRKPNTIHLLERFRDELSKLTSLDYNTLRRTVDRVVVRGNSAYRNVDIHKRSQLIDLMQSGVVNEAAEEHEAFMHQFVSDEGIKIGDIIHAVRVAVTGKGVGPGLFECMEILGTEACLKRIDQCILLASEDSIADSQSKYPPAIFPTLPYEDINKPVELYSGEGALAFASTENDRSSFSVHCKAIFNWLPRPDLRFHISSKQNVFAKDLFFDTSVSLQTPGLRVNCGVQGAHWGTPDGTRLDLFPLEPVRFGESDGIHFATFYLTNFHSWRGEIIREGRGVRAGRATALVDGWRITIDELAGASKRLRVASEAAGFALSHIGKIEREGSEPFTPDDCTEVLDALQQFLSFARGFWVAPLIITGYDRADRQVWHDWTARHTESYRAVESWFPVHDVQYFQLAFSEYWRATRDSSQRKSIESIIYWYLQSTNGPLDRTIVLACVALEHLAASLGSTPNGRSSLDSLSAYFESTGIGVSIPEQLNVLRETVDSANGLEAIFSIRAAIAHPSANDLFSVLECPRHTELLWETRRLALRFIELGLLKLIEYDGIIAKRIGARWVGPTEHVPWAPDE